MVRSELETHDPRLHPAFEVEGNAVVLNPLQIVSMQVDRLGERVGSLKSDGDRIVAALDLVISRAWD